MKKFYTLKLFLTVLFAAVFGTMSADVSSNFTDEKLTVSSGELGWTASIAAQQWDSQYDRGVQFGTSKSPVGTFTLTAGQSLTQVTSVSITASASGAGNTISVNVGGVEFTGDVTEIASGTQNANQVYTFTGPATDGVITITIDDNTKAVWVKSIAVACTESSVEGGGDTPDPEPEPEPEPEEGVIFSESFATSQGSFTIDDVNLPEGLSYVWKNDNNYGYMKASAFVSGTGYAAESWLISPEIDLTAQTGNVTLTFEQACNYFKGTLADAVSVQVREQGGEWTKLDVTGWPESDSWDFVNATADLSAYAGKTIQLAFVYTSTAEVAGTWELKNVTVRGGEGGTDPEPPVGEDDVTFFSETFADGQGDFTIDNVQEPASGGYVWSHDSSHGYMKASCFIGGQDLAAESWLISPAIDLTKATAATLSFSHCANFFDGAVADALSVQVREQGGEWTKLEVSQWPAGNTWDWVDATADLSAYVGKTVEIAFVYTSQDGDAGTWEVKNVSVAGKGEAGEQPDPEPEPEPEPEPGVIFSETFATGEGTFTIDNTTLPEELSYVWSNDDRYACMKASAYVNGTNYAAESWLVSPEIDLTAQTGTVTLTFEHATNFFKGTLADAVSVQVREKDGEWTALNVTGWPESDGWTFVDATADLSAYAGKTIQIAFVYTSTADVAGTWEVRNVVIRGEEGGDTPEPEPEPGVIFSETFATGEGTFTIDNTTLPEGLSYVWSNDDRYSCMKASAYVQGTNYAAESWLISPEIDLTAQTGTVTLTFEHATNFFKGTLADAVSVQVREKDGQWTTLNVTGWPETDSWTFVDASADLSAYAGKTIQIAFVYTSTADVAGTWEVRNVVVSGEEGGDEPIGPEPPVADVVFNFNANAWGLPVSDSSNPTQGNVTAPITQDGVTLTAEGGSTAPRMYLNFTTQLPQLRVYKGATVTLTAPEGKKFLSITWYDGNDKFSATADNGTWDDASYTWTGEATTVTFTIAGTSNTNFIALDLDNTTGIDGLTDGAANAPVDVYSIDGRLLRTNVARSEAANGLPAGIYVIGGQKVVVK